MPVGSFYSSYDNDGIVFIKVGDVNVNTGASVYSNFKLSEISNDHLLFNSSDLGEYIITNKISGKWDSFEAKTLRINNCDIYIVSKTPKSECGERESEGILVVFKKGNELQEFNLDGKFHLKFSEVKVGENSLQINAAPNTYTFEITDKVNFTSTLTK